MFLLGLDRIGIPHAAGRQLYLACRWSTLCAMIMQLLGFDHSNGINCEVRIIRPLYRSDWRVRLSQLLGFAHHDIRKILHYTGGVILVPSGYADIFLYYVLVRILYDYCAHVSEIFPCRSSL